MADYAGRVWLLPALAVAAHAILFLAEWQIPGSAPPRVRHMVRYAYEAMFWVSPAVGVAVLAWALWLRLSRGASHPLALLAVWFGLLALAAPVCMILLTVVLSGLSR